MPRRAPWTGGSTFPDGSVGLAQSRVTETTRGTCIYSFVLHAPPVALEQVEGALEAQRATLHVRARDAEIADGAVMTQPMTLEDVARRAIDGDRDALDSLVRELQGDIYGLALRMLWNREDAEDATQEILVRVVTRLSQFDFRSRLKTWVYRVAVNYILDVKKSPVERMHLTFERFADDLADGLSPDGPLDAERSLLVEEVKIGCTLGMLQCLDRPHRLAYVLGEILDMPGPEAAEALGITPDALSQAPSTRAHGDRVVHALVLRARVGHSRVRLQPSCAGGAPRRKSPRRCAATCQQRPRRSRRRARSFAKSRRRDGRSRFTEPAILVLRRSTSHVVWPKHSTRGPIDVPERRIAIVVMAAARRLVDYAAGRQSW